MHIHVLTYCDFSLSVEVDGFRGEWIGLRTSIRWGLRAVAAMGCRTTGISGENTDRNPSRTARTQGTDNTILLYIYICEPPIPDLKFDWALKILHRNMNQELLQVHEPEVQCEEAGREVQRRPRHPHHHLRRATSPLRVPVFPPRPEPAGGRPAR